MTSQNTAVSLARPLMLMRLALALAGLTLLVVFISARSGAGFLPRDVVGQGLVFYALTAGGYAALPLVRRGDIFAVAMWMVLGVGVAPCFKGEELSAAHMFANMGGVILAAGPIYIARFRQVIQGDTRDLRRRGKDD